VGKGGKEEKNFMTHPVSVKIFQIASNAEKEYFLLALAAPQRQYP
jgi:hypothetical protein